VRALAFTEVSFSYPGAKLFRRQSTPVFDRFSWPVPEGRTVLLGPNGAGKSTLMALASTAIQPAGGRVSLGDLDSSRRRDLPALRRAIGWMPQRVRVVPGLTSREQVAYAGWLKGLPRSAAWKAAIEALRAVDLADQAERLTSQLSGGQQQRVALAQLLVHRAEVLLLDEPTAGLDPGQRARLRESLRDLGHDFQIVVSTHQVDDLNDLFDKVVVLDRGRIRFEGTVEAFVSLAPTGSSRAAETAYATLVAAEA